MRVRKLRVQLDCFFGELDGLDRQFRYAQEAALQIVSRRQRRPRARVVRVHLGGFLKVVNRTVKRIAAAGSKVDHPAREALVRFD